MWSCSITIWSVKTNVYYQVKIKVTVSTNCFWTTARDYNNAHMLSFRLRSAGWRLAANSKSLQWTVPMVLCFWSHQLCQVAGNILARHSATLGNRSVHQEFVHRKSSFIMGTESFFPYGPWSKSYEHSIKFLKEDSGAKWLCGQREEQETTELSKPEVLKAMGEFENACLHLKPRTVYSIANPQLLTRRKILNHLEALCNLVNEGMILNPFKETGTELSTQARLWTWCRQVPSGSSEHWPKHEQRLRENQNRNS